MKRRTIMAICLAALFGGCPAPDTTSAPTPHDECTAGVSGGIGSDNLGAADTTKPEYCQ